MLATFVIAAMGLAPGSPEQVRTEAGIVTLFAKYVDHPSGIVVYAATMAFLAIRRRDVARHREWMIRTFAMMIGIGTVRLVSVPFVFTTRLSYETITVASMWVGWVLTLGVAEWWIRRTRTAMVGLRLAHLARDPAISAP